MSKESEKGKEKLAEGAGASGAATISELTPVLEMDFIDKLLDEILDKMEDDLAITMSEFFQYQGFDPVAIVSKLWHMAVEQNVPRNTFMVNMQTICIFYLLRGTRYDRDKVPGKSTESARKIMNKMIIRYQIQRGEPRGREDITIGRIATVFPNVCAQLMHKGIGRLIAPIEGLPRALMFPQAPAIIPVDVAWNGVYTKWLEWAKKVNETLKPIGANGRALLQTVEEKATRFETTKALSEAARNNISFMKNERRLNLMMKLGINEALVDYKESKFIPKDLNLQRGIILESVKTVDGNVNAMTVVESARAESKAASSSKGYSGT